MVEEVKELEKKYQELIVNLPEYILDDNKEIIKHRIDELSKAVNNIIRYIDTQELE